MKKASLLLTLLMLMCFGMSKAEIVEIGASGGTETSNKFLPTYTYYKYSLTQQLYMPYEVDFVGSISRLCFYNESEDRERTFDLYLVAASKETFSSTTDWVPFSESDMVFSGSVNFKKGEWTEIKFNKKNFHRSAQDILAVIMVDNTGTYQSGTVLFKSYTTTSGQAMYKYEDTEGFDVGHLSEYSGTILNVKNQILLRGSDDAYIVAPLRSDELPLNSNSMYSMTEQIYTKEEIGRGGSITSISFYNKSEPVTRNIDIYLGETEYTYISTSQSSINATKDQLVFSGNVTFAEKEWTTITFTKPFKYSGENNLFVITDDNTGTIMSSPSYFLTFRTEDTAIGQAFSVSPHGSENINPCAQDGIFESHSVKNRIKLDIEGGSSSQSGTIEIGLSGESTNSYLPTYSFYNYSLTQQIYTQSEMGAAKDLTSVSFFNAGEEKMRNMDIYLVHTGKTVFTSDNDWIDFTKSDRAFSGNVTFEKDMWTTITFDTPFSYNGIDNLVLIVDDNTGEFSQGLACRVFDAPSQTLRIYSDDTNYNAGGLSNYSGTRMNVKNQITFAFATVINFETGDFSQFKFQNGSEHPWIVTNTAAADGNYCMMSGNAGVASSTSIIFATYTYEEDGYVCFDAMCMGEGTSTPWDKCVFYIDEEVQFTYGALGNYWTFYYYPVTSGTHTFKWEYTKDSSVNPEGDAFFVDNLRFLQGRSAEDMMDGISPLTSAPTGKEGIYNLTGQRLSKVQKGINIIGGRKVLVKSPLSCP